MKKRIALILAIVMLAIPILAACEAQRGVGEEASDEASNGEEKSGEISSGVKKSGEAVFAPYVLESASAPVSSSESPALISPSESNPPETEGKPDLQPERLPEGDPSPPIPSTPIDPRLLSDAEWRDIYDVILSQYREMIDIVAQGEFSISQLGKDVNATALGPKVFYTLYDVDGDGIPELLLAGGEASCEHGVVDVFTYRDGSVVNVFGFDRGWPGDGRMEFGLKLFCYPLNNGVIMADGYVGSGFLICEFYRISPNGYAELIEGVFIDVNFGRVRCVYYTELPEELYSPEITEKEYNDIKSKYMESGIIENSEAMVWRLISE